jgi:hypothetical protein
MREAMKKIYMMVSLTLSSTSFGQQIATFEDLGLPANSHWDGSDSTGGFTSGSVYFMNEYNHDWSYWSGGFIRALRTIPLPDTPTIFLQLRQVDKIVQRMQ